MMKNLDGKVALVTGAGRGIGREIALKLARAGAVIVANDLDADCADQLAAEIEATGSQVISCVGNVTEKDFGERFVNTASENFGAIDIIINNAGYTWDSVLQKMTDEQWYAMLDVHLTAPFRILRAAQPVFKELAIRDDEQGVKTCRKVVNISSLAGICGNAGQVNYSVAKAGVIGLTKTVAKEFARYRVNVNAVAFGFIETRLTSGSPGEATITIEGQDIGVGVNADLLKMATALIPLGRPGTAEEAAGAVFNLCTPESDYVTGETVICSGGLIF